MKLTQVEYKRPDFKMIVKEFNSLAEQFKNAKSAEEQLAIDKKLNDIYEEVYTTTSLVMIRYSQNTKDKFYQKEYKYLNKKISRIRLKMLKYYRMFVETKYKSGLEKVVPLHVFHEYENMQKIFNKKIIFNIIKESNVKMAYTKLMSNLSFEFQGKKMNHSTISKFFQSPNRDERKAAYEAFGKAIISKAENLDNIYDKLVKLRVKKAQKLGFSSYTDVAYLEMNRHGYTKEDIAKFRENVKKYLVPLSVEIKERVKKEFKFDKFMLYDDEIFTATEPKPIGSKDEIMANGLKMYQEMSDETGNLFKLMLESEAFDVESRDGKRGGGFCSSLPKYKLPFILANFNGSLGDVKVLTHEFGHALAASKSFDLPDHYGKRYGMEIAEVHSMTMEFLTYKWMNLFFQEATAEYKFSHIAKSITFIPYGTIVDYFQQLIYDNPSLTKSKRNQTWISLEQEFLPYMSCEGIPAFEEGRRWQRQQHIYTLPFYYIDYCLAQVTAFQFLDLMQKDYNQAFNKYIEFVNQAGTKTFTDLLKSVGLKSPFEEQTFIDIVNVVRRNLNL